MTYVYVVERARDVGLHTHFRVHIPTDRWDELRERVVRCLMRRGGFTNLRAVKLTPDDGRTPGAATQNQREGLFFYLGGGLDPTEIADHPFEGRGRLVDQLGIAPKPGLSLPINLKRVGFSEDLGPKARRDNGTWVEKNELMEMVPDAARLKRHALSQIRRRLRAGAVLPATPTRGTSIAWGGVA